MAALANEGILLLKASALVSTITVLDLMGHARTVFSRSYDLWVYGGAAFLYILLTALVTLVAFLIRRYWFQSLPSDPWFREFSLGANSYKQPSPRPHRPQEHHLLLHHAHAGRYLEHPKGNLPTHLQCPCLQTCLTVCGNSAFFGFNLLVHNKDPNFCGFSASSSPIANANVCSSSTSSTNEHVSL